MDIQKTEDVLREIECLLERNCGLRRFEFRVEQGGIELYRLIFDNIWKKLNTTGYYEKDEDGEFKPATVWGFS